MKKINLFLICTDTFNLGNQNSLILREFGLNTL